MDEESALLRDIMNVLKRRHPGRMPLTNYKSLLDACFSISANNSAEEMFGDGCSAKMVSELASSCRNFYRQRLTPRVVVRHIDLDGGGFLTSYQNVDALRKIDTDGVKGRRALFPSGSRLSLYATQVQAAAAPLVPFVELDKTDGHEGKYCKVFL